MGSWQNNPDRVNTTVRSEPLSCVLCNGRHGSCFNSGSRALASSKNSYHVWRQFRAPRKYPGQTDFRNLAVIWRDKILNYGF
ncbi:hypothetical protein KsCSTR_01630 [Candidatus Kuenenia stuttgartiensis]|uniref:Uncharacterized protein n=1 Tax=Kuenenia stuttgartiensis TaxID=174633 RepID=Q1PUZ4_KUEST|nr:hypothetical protein KsCSTR_01630 [Candidatus Kuenenia stuttgartiensis]CAJ71039.1 unknown protein [Candidatus Kuenenia stuttgartiensis]